MSSEKTPSVEEMQRRLQEFFRHTMQGTESSFMAQPEATTDQDDTPPPEEAKKFFEFPWKPKDIKAHLDRFVIKQHEAKKVLSIAVCDHYNAVRQAEAKGSDAPHYNKQNVMMLGPTGVGKTYLIKHLAELIGVPMVKADATKFTETGYVGGDVEDLVRDLLHQVDGDIHLAQYGIIYIDEIDKLAGTRSSNGRDISGRGVQTNLLKLMEDAEVPLRGQNDLQSQLQAAFEFNRPGSAHKKETINTRYILFIVSGAFDQLPDLIEKRVSKGTIGFQAIPSSEEAPDEILAQVATKDFIEYGLEPEFIGRLPVRVACSPLKEEDLFNILKYSEESLVHQYESAFQAYGIEVLFTDTGLKKIAHAAAEENTGARGLATICEKVLRGFKFELPGSGIRQLVIDEKLVVNPEKELNRVLTDETYEETIVMGELIQEFGRRFADKHQLQLDFTSEAIEKLVQEAQANQRSIVEHCQVVFKDFEFGLKLIYKNSKQDQFIIDAQVVADPEKSLSNWVVKSYKKKKPA